MRDSFIKGLTTVAKSDPKVMLLTADLGYGVLDDFRKQCPTQFLNVGIAEQNMIGIATGLAIDGHVVYTYSIANFSFMRCLEQIRNDAAYHGCNVNVVAIGGGFSYGALGISHHATEDLAIMRSIPDVTVLAPGDNFEAEAVARATYNTPGVSYTRLDRVGAGESHNDDNAFTIGKSRVLRPGKDLTLIATGGIVSEAIKVADVLSTKNVSVRVVSLHTIKPIDKPAIIEAARETGGILTMEEHCVDGGLGGAVAEILLEAGAPPKFFKRIGLRDGFSSIVGSQQFLRKQYGLDEQTIVNLILKRIASKSPLRAA